MKCPYCGSKMADRPHIPLHAMTRMQRLVYDAVLKAGPNGLSAVKLSSKTGSSLDSLRPRVHYLNKVIHPMKVKCHGKTYFLTES